jgi:hypothetical protein
VLDGDRPDGLRHMTFAAIVALFALMTSQPRLE